MPAPSGPRPIRTTHVAGLHAVVAAALDGRNRGALAREDARAAGQAEDAVGVERLAIDRRGLDHRALGREVARHEADRRSSARALTRDRGS